MRVKGDGIFSINTSASGGFGNAGISLPEIVVEESGGGNLPPITADLQVYYNPDVEVYSDNIGTLAVDGDNVRQFNDQSGNSNTLTQTSASSQPLYKTSVLGNDNASLQAQNDALNFTTNISRGTTDDFTIYLVYKRDNTSNTAYILKGTNGVSPRLHFNSTSHLWRSTSGGTAALLDYTATTDVEIVAYTFDRTAQEAKMYINNSLQDTYSLYFGRRFEAFNKIFANATNIINFGSALIYYASHDATDVGTVSDWLNTKYQTY